MQSDIGDVGVERLADAIADEPDQGIEVEMGGKRLADAVHGRQLGNPLARLMDELGVLREPHSGFLQSSREAACQTG